ncbi:uncharacterized protein B0H18DRAFT_121421 [Fomitopsis serialis]|uniref:uncharacterized protein n=1 Tax=Fomitopsis serialis TaxID=139415 RepID=UPI002008C2E0|nr:uncharacterized protein B0H18DRAFT_121421 [Neoantrodia serialis]KAH9931015.1 hypothetical protein B0H18DRAFT_121421 [Neoantrodia serialis]
MVTVTQPAMDMPSLSCQEERQRGFCARLLTVYPKRSPNSDTLRPHPRVLHVRRPAQLIPSTAASNVHGPRRPASQAEPHTYKARKHFTIIPRHPRPPTRRPPSLMLPSLSLPGHLTGGLQCSRQQPNVDGVSQCAASTLVRVTRVVGWSTSLAKPVGPRWTATTSPACRHRRVLDSQRRLCFNVLHMGHIFSFVYIRSLTLPSAMPTLGNHLRTSPRIRPRSACRAHLLAQSPSPALSLPARTLARSAARPVRLLTSSTHPLARAQLSASR